MQRYNKKSHAIIFFLSNKIVQVYFKDHTELIIDTRLRQLTYLASDGNVTKLPVREANNSKDEELKKRFDYIKAILKGEEKPSKSRSPER